MASESQYGLDHRREHDAETLTEGRGGRFRLTRADLVVGVLLILVFAAGIYFRFVGQNWDDFTHLHPDERFLTQVAENIGGPLNLTDPNPQTRAEHMRLCTERYPESNGVGPLFDSQCSNWYPKNVGHGLYVYGELPLFTVRIAAEITRAAHLFQVRLEACQALDSGLSFLDCFNAALSDDLADPLVQAINRAVDPEAQVLAYAWTTYSGVHLVGRTVSAVTELLSLVLLFLIGRRLYNKWIGLLAVALAAAAVFPIQLSHFWTTDAFTNLPVLFTFYCAILVMERGRYLNFALFGLGMGAALASRVNTLPLFGVVVLAAIIYALPALDRALENSERWRLIQKAFLGVVLAGLVTLVVFRFTYPHAFIGGPGLLGVFDLRPYQPFLNDMAQAQYLTSGHSDSPPNHQWASRTPYLFPAQNIVLWGMGLPLGLAAWFGFGWAGWQIVRARPRWTRHVLVFAWVLIYFGYMGRLWVMTMRYYMPLYPFLILLAAWALLEIVSRAWRWMRRNPVRARQIAFGAGTGLLVFVVAFTYLWASMFTSIYRRQLTRVEASHWFLRNVPSAVSATLVTPDGTEWLVNISLSRGVSPDINVTHYGEGARRVVPLVSQEGQIDRVVVNHLVDPDRAGQVKTFWAGIATDQSGTALLAAGSLEGDFSGGVSALGDSYTILLDKPVRLDPAQPFFLVTWSEAPLVVGRQGFSTSEFSLYDGPTRAVSQVSLPDALNAGQASAVFGATPLQLQFTAPLEGTFDHVHIAHLLNPLQDNRNTTLRVRVSDAATGQALASGTLSVDANATHRSPFGDPRTIRLDEPVKASAGQTITLTLSTVDGGPARVTGSVVSTEGPWDDPVPHKVCELPPEMALSEQVPPGLFNAVECRGSDPWGTFYRGLELYMAAEDDWQKQQILQTVLDEADYITFSSNRFYDSLSRIPTRFPMSMAFYDAMFSGQLGFELVKTVSSSFALGAFQIPDQHLPIDDSPKWLNEWESEEAFSVYDHPTVFIFRKNPERYDSKLTAQLLQSVPLNDDRSISFQNEDATIINVIRWGALQASAAPNGLMMEPDLRDIQTQGGTWSALFSREWLINAQPVLAVILWWLVIVLFGLLIWPVLYALLPGLPDRAYPMAKIAGLLVVAWIAWAGGALRFLTWSQAGILLIMLAVGVTSALIAWRRRGELLAYVRLNWKHFAIIELITAVLFVAFLLVRLGNPDLWAQSLGGEKPMNFAYFNAVLRSTVFPPYDPWYAGGYMNYYYFGYVLVGAPVKLLGLMPSMAYNLIVPTLFALTGIGAFSLAFNVVAARWFAPRRDDPPEEEPAPEAPLRERRRFALRVPKGSPYLAGSLALLLCVVLGNLGTPSVFASSVALSGGCPAAPPDMYAWSLGRFVEREGRQPNAEESARLFDAANNPNLFDQIGYGVYTLRHSVECFFRGVGQTLSGAYLQIPANRWFWAPRSILSELPGYSNEINEFPYFTFVFGDLHAHMIAMPITLLVIGWLLAEVLIAGERRPTWVVIAATALGGLSIGILQATNTWDWITYLVLGMVGLPFAIFLRRHRLTREHVTAWAAQLGWLFMAQSIAMLPFTTFFATAYSAVQSFQGPKTPIWAYFTMHGLFLFAIVSLFVWQTARLLRHSYVRDFIGRTWPLRLIAAAAAVVAFVMLFLALVPGQFFLINPPIPLALLLLPLILWCAVLLLLPDQSREGAVVYMLVGLAFAISLGVEIVVLEGDIGRQNTFFKFYIQVWLLLSVASGIGLAWLFHALRRWQPLVRGSWLVAIALFFSVAGLFPIMATQGKIHTRMAPEAPHDLDGNAYMNYAVYYEGPDPVPLRDDLEIIHWLQDNVEGTPVILEAHQYPSEYKYNARIAINTGLPTLLGWQFHQKQQRPIDPLPNLVSQRRANVWALYNTPDIHVAWRLLRFYRVEYIIVAKLEQITYHSAGLAKFRTMANRGLLEVVYDRNGDRIYRVIRDAQPDDLIVGSQLGSPSYRINL